MYNLSLSMCVALLHITILLLPVWIFYSCSVGLQGQNTTVVMAHSLSLTIQQYRRSIYKDVARCYEAKIEESEKVGSHDS